MSTPRSQPTLRGRVVVKFPARVIAGPGIIIDKSGQDYTFSFDPASLPPDQIGVPEAPLDGSQYGRQNGAWTVVTAGGGGGPDFTTDVTITKSNPSFIVNKAASGQTAAVYGQTAGSNRWRVVLGDVSPETGGDEGSDFRIDSYHDDGSFKNICLHIDRKNSEVTITADPAAHHPILALNKLGGGQAASFQGRYNGSLRWQLAIADSDAETGANTGSNFRLNRYNDSGGFIDAVFYIERKTGRVSIIGGAAPNYGMLAINKPTSGTANSIVGMTAGKNRWQMALGDGAVEPGSNVGSDFRLQRYDDNGNLIDVPLWIKRSDGVVTVTGSPASLQPLLVINKTASGQAAAIMGQKLTVPRWSIGLGDGDVELGGNQGSNYRLHRFDDSGAFLGAVQYIIRANGEFYQYAAAYKPGGGLWADSSDARIKNVVGPYQSGLTEVLALNPVKYTYKGNDVQHPDAAAPPTVVARGGRDPQSGHYIVSGEGKEFIGVIAQEAEIPMPELVRLTTARIDGVEVNDYRILDTSPLVFALVNAIKDLNIKIEALEGRVAALETPLRDSDTPEGGV